MTDLAWSRLTIVNADDSDDPREYWTFIWPVGDTIEHDEENFACPCGPKLKMEIGIHTYAHGQGGLCICTYNQIVHNSLDGRELFE